MKNKTLLKLCMIFVLTGCSLTPGLNDPQSSFSGNDEVFLPEKNLVVPIIDVSEDVLKTLNDNYTYTVSPGDVLTFIIWGLEDIFPTVNFGSAQINPQNSRTVNTDGTIFFPFAGEIKVEGLSISQVRQKVYKLLSKDFVDPQIDVTVTKYNENRRAYLMGEVIKPQSFYVGIEKISLTDAVGLSSGLDPRFSNAGKIYIVRSFNNKPTVFRVNLKSPEKFLLSNNFYIRPQDIIYVSPSGITRWNRFFSQIFPFASFFNQIDNIRD
tara:strand:+ start:61 stop:861 length:801 start_codon:yes stop_codon:yes gene_type:complete